MRTAILSPCASVSIALALSLTACAVAHGAAPTPLRAGAARSDITPDKLPILVNGWICQRSAKRVLDPLRSRAIVLDSGAGKLAMVVVDNLMMDVDMLDKAKALATVRDWIRSLVVTAIAP